MSGHLAAAKPKQKAPLPVTPLRAGLLQRACACGGNPGVDGDCAECRAKRLQSKAANASAHVLSTMTTQSGLLQRCACGKTPGVDGECAECRARRLSMQRNAAPAASSPSVPSIVHDVLGSPGHSLDAGTRAFMEPRFGHDFNHVRVHTDAKAAESARAVNALAYTVGRDVVFGTGQYAPGTSGGMKLMAHELTHVVQQSSWNALQSKLEIGPMDDAFEREADKIAENVLDKPSSASEVSTVRGIQRTVGGVVSPARLQRTIGDGHDLKSQRFSGDPVLEACYDNERLLRKRDQGGAVKKIQQALLDLRYSLPQFGVDGKFGDETETAVKNFQRDSKLAGKNVDGVIGPITMGLLDARFAGTPPPPTDIRKIPVDFEVKTDREGQIGKDGKIIEPDMKVRPKTLKQLTPTEDKPIDSKYHLVVQVGPLFSIPGSPPPHGFCEDSSLVVGGKYNWEGIPIGKKLSLLGEPELDINVLPGSCGTSPGATIQTNLLKLSILKNVFEASLQGIFGLNDNWIKTWGLTGGGGAELDYKFGCKKLGRINMSSTLFGTLTWTWKQGTGGNADTMGVNGLLGLKFELPDDCD